MMQQILTLNLVVPDAIEAMKFYEAVFDGQRGDVYEFPKRTGENEANIIVGGVALRLIDANATYQCFPPNKGEVDSIWLQIIVDNTDDTLALAKQHGANISQEVSEFMGTRHGEIIDPFGYTWTINQVIRELSYEERYETYVSLQEEQQVDE